MIINYLFLNFITFNLPFIISSLVLSWIVSFVVVVVVYSDSFVFYAIIQKTSNNKMDIFIYLI